MKKREDISVNLKARSKMKLLPSKVILLFALYIVSAYPYEIENGLFIDCPEGWQITKGQSPVVFIAQSSVGEQDPGNPTAPRFFDNMIVTSQSVSMNQKSLFQKDPEFYIQVILYNIYPTLLISNISKRTITKIPGVWVKSTVQEKSGFYGSVQFYFVHGNKIYSITFSCLAGSLVKKDSFIEKYLVSLKAN